MTFHTPSSSSHRRSSASISHSHAVSTSSYPYPVLPMHSDELGRLPFNPPYNTFDARGDQSVNTWRLPSNGKADHVEIGSRAGTGSRRIFPSDSGVGEQVLSPVSDMSFRNESLLVPGYAYDGMTPGAGRDDSQMLLSGTGTYPAGMHEMTSPTNGQFGTDNEIMHDVWSNLPSGFEYLVSSLLLSLTLTVPFATGWKTGIPISPGSGASTHPETRMLRCDRHDASVYSPMFLTGLSTSHCTQHDSRSHSPRIDSILYHVGSNTLSSSS